MLMLGVSLAATLSVSTDAAAQTTDRSIAAVRHEADRLEKMLDKVPSPYAMLGIQDPRRIVPPHAGHPFDAVVGITVKRPNGTQDFCSGVILYERDLVATARHCVSAALAEQRTTGGKPQILVRISQPGTSQAEVIDADLIEAGPMGLSSWHDMRWPDDERKTVRKFPVADDWAVLKLHHVPNRAVEPLALIDDRDLYRPTQDFGIVAGFPFDVEGGTTLTAQVCPAISGSDYLVPLSHRDPYKTEQNFVYHHFLSCLGISGNSGGPLLWWDSNSKRYRVAGLVVIGTVGARTSEIKSRQPVLAIRDLQPIVRRDGQRELRRGDGALIAESHIERGKASAVAVFPSALVNTLKEELPNHPVLSKQTWYLLALNAAVAQGIATQPGPNLDSNLGSTSVAR